MLRRMLLATRFGCRKQGKKNYAQFDRGSAGKQRSVTAEIAVEGGSVSGTTSKPGAIAIPAPCAGALTGSATGESTGPMCAHDGSRASGTATGKAPPVRFCGAGSERNEPGFAVFDRQHLKSLNSLLIVSRFERIPTRAAVEGMENDPFSIHQSDTKPCRSFRQVSAKALIRKFGAPFKH
jgi:hypothetical protein